LEDEEDTGIIDINNYKFENDPPDSAQTVVIFEDFLDLKKEEVKADSSIKLPPSIRSYGLNFAKDYSVTQLTNNFNNDFYQSAIYGADAANPGTSSLAKVGVSDLFEDKRITGGIRFSLSLDNREYGISYDNLTNRMDKRITFQRQFIQGVREISPGFLAAVKIHTHVLKHRWKWPFSEVSSIRFSLMGRHENEVVLANRISWGIYKGRSNSYFRSNGIRF